MLTRIYVITVPIHGSELWCELARSNEPQIVGEIVRALVAASNGGPASIRIESQLEERNAQT